VSALAEALVAAQRRALQSVEKAYVGGKLDGEQATARLAECGITDPVDLAYLLASLDVLKEWGATLPAEPKANGESEKASEKQAALIVTLCKRHNQPVPEALDVLTKAQASEIIDALDQGTYDSAKWTVPF
jgi:hypothetical protein